MTSRVWIYRHAESLSNAGATTFEPAGIPLTDRGYQEAAVLAATIPRAPDLIVTSPFLRAIETVAPVMARFPVAARASWPIQEFTYLEPSTCIGTSWVERKPRVDAYWAALDPDYRDGPNAETFADLLVRARAFLAELEDLKRGLALAVSHGQFMRAVEILAEEPDLAPATAMRLFVKRQQVRPFANCERLALAVADGQTRIVP